MTAFTLHPRLAADTAPVGRLPLSLVRLSRDARYPWVVLVPACALEGGATVTELHELSPEDRAELVEEASAVGAVMAHLFDADKMNVAALGNMVPQLHVHVVARRRDDDAWPGAIWGAHEALVEEAEALAARVTALREALAPVFGFEPGA